MKVFTVYKHNLFGYEAVKVVFSWTGLILNTYIPWWMLWKGLILLAITFGIINFGFIYYFAEQGIGLTDIPVTPNDWFLLTIQVLINLIPGFYGNSWLHKKYKDKGYLEIKSLPASSKDAAIAIAKNEDIDNTNSSNSLEDIDEASELIYDKSYTNAYSEIQQYEIDKDIGFIKNQDIWARAYALSDGDENKQKVIYVNLQAKELDFEYDFEVEQAKKKKNNKGLVIVGIVLIAIVIVANTF